MLVQNGKCREMREKTAMIWKGEPHHLFIEPQLCSSSDLSDGCSEWCYRDKNEPAYSWPVVAWSRCEHRFQNNRDRYSPSCVNVRYITSHKRTSRKSMGRNQNITVHRQNYFNSKSSFRQSGSKWMLTVNWRSVESGSSWERLTRVAGEKWLIIVCLCVCVYDYYSCGVAMIRWSQLGCKRCAQPLLPFLIY